MVDLDSDPTKLIDIVGSASSCSPPRLTHHLSPSQRRCQVTSAIHPAMVRGFASVSVLNDLNVMTAEPTFSILSADLQRLDLVMRIPVGTAGREVRCRPRRPVLKGGTSSSTAAGCYRTVHRHQLIDMLLTATGVK